MEKWPNYIQTHKAKGRRHWNMTSLFITAENTKKRLGGSLETRSKNQTLSWQCTHILLESAIRKICSTVLHRTKKSQPREHEIKNGNVAATGNNKVRTTAFIPVPLPTNSTRVNKALDWQFQFLYSLTFIGGRSLYWRNP